MVQVRFKSSAGTIIDVEEGAGRTLLEAALSADVPGIIGDCGGELSCGTCHVYVDQVFLDKLPAPSADEQAMIEDGVIDPAPNSRLCCQITLVAELEGLSVEVGAND